MKGRIKNELASVKQEVRDKTVGYIVTALGLVAGLAWNDAIKTTIEEFFPAKHNGIWAKFIYAGLITIIVVFLSVYLSKIFKKEKKEEAKTKK